MKKVLFLLTLFILGTATLSQVNAQKRLYVKATGGNNTNYGKTWLNAVQNLDTALNRAQATDTILVAAGTYTGSFIMKEGVTVLGGFPQNADASTTLQDRKLPGTKQNLTILDGNNSQRPLTQLKPFSTATVWEGFVLQNGNAPTGGGAYLLQNGVLRNTIVQNNTVKTPVPVPGQYIPEQGGVVYRVQGTTAYVMAMEDCKGGTNDKFTTKVASIYTSRCADAGNHFNGKAETDSLIAKGSTAAIAARNYRDAAGHTDWYLPAAGDWKLFVSSCYDTSLHGTDGFTAIFDTVQNGLTRNGGKGIEILDSPHYWSSSTADNASLAWMVNVGYGYLFDNYVDNVGRVRSVRAFNLVPSEAEGLLNYLGGGVYMGSGASVEGCLVQNNTAPNGSGVYNGGGSLLNSTVVNNIADISLLSNVYKTGDLYTFPNGDKGIVFYTEENGTKGWAAALQEANNGNTCQWLPSGSHTIPGITQTSSTVTATADTAGYANTLALRNYMVNNNITNKEDYAAYKTDFANGWYLPAAGQLNKLYAVLPEVNAALTTHGGTQLETSGSSRYWSSTQYNSVYAWYVYFYDGYLYSRSVYSDYVRVRSVRAFQLFNNLALSNLSGLLAGAGSQTTNTIVCNNTEAVNHTTANLYNMGGTVTYTAVEGTVSAGEGNQIVLVSDFINVAAGDFHLAEMAPLRGAGNITSVPQGFAQDLEGNARIQNNQVDMGAFQTLPIEKVCITLQSNPNNAGEVAFDKDRNCFIPGETVIAKVLTVNSSYTFVNWTLEEGTEVSTDKVYQFTATQNMTLVANFTKKPIYTISLQANPTEGGTVELGYTQETQQEFDEGEYIHAFVLENELYEFVNWTVDDTVASDDPSYYFYVTRNMTLVANFTKKTTYTISLQANPTEGGTVVFNDCSYTPETQKEFEEGEYIFARALENELYEFVNWTVDDTIASDDPYYHFYVTRNMTLVANFTKKPIYTISLQANPTEGGTVGLNGYGDTPETQQEFEEGKYIYAYALENELYEFVSWTVDDTIASDDPFCRFYVTRNMTLVANFTKKPTYTISLQANPTEGGTVGFNGYGDTYETQKEFEEGEYIFATALENELYEFVNWTVDDTIASDDPDYEFYVTRNMTLVANFTKKTTYTISLQANPTEGGTVGFNGCGDTYETQKEFEEGEYIFAYVLEKDGYEFVNWTVDNTEVSNDPFCRFCVTKNMNLVVNLKTPQEATYTVSVGENYQEAASVSGAGTYIENRPITLSTETNEGFVFKHWEVASTGQVLSNQAVYTFTLTQDTNIKAVYAKLYTVTTAVAPENIGTITGAGLINGSGIFAEGFTVTLTAAPKIGFAFKNWTASGSPVGTAAVYSFQVTDNTHLTANFVSTNATLNGLTVLEGTLKPGFRPTDTSYAVNVGNSVTSITITPVTTHNNASWIEEGDSPTNLQEGNNNIIVKVTAEDGVTTKEYLLRVVRQHAAPATDATLKSLTVNKGTLSPAFDATKTSYTVNVANDVTTITIHAETNNEFAIVDGIGNKTLKAGVNIFDILVIAEDGVTTLTYKVTVNRAKNTDATLSNITLSTGVLDPVFSSAVKNYEVLVDHDIKTITITATPNFSGATVVVNGNTTLDSGSNVFTIIVTAEDSITTETYTVTVVRADKSGINTVGKEKSTVKVYPNPTTGIVNIETEGNLIPKVKLFTVDGKLLLQTKTNQLDLSTYAKGVYYVHINDQIVKIVKK